jgi:hypothetical protein
MREIEDGEMENVFIKRKTESNLYNFLTEQFNKKVFNSDTFV